MPFRDNFLCFHIFKITFKFKILCLKLYLKLASGITIQKKKEKKKEEGYFSLYEVITDEKTST